MNPRWFFATLIVAVGCGRFGFEPSSGTVGDAAADGPSIDGAPATTSCVELPTSCGPAGSTTCCSSPLVPGGSFLRGFDYGTDDLYSDMTGPATISDFRLDTYEVTVGRFRQFVNAGMGTRENPPPNGSGARGLNGQANRGGWEPDWNASLAGDASGLVAAVKCNPSSWTDAPGANDALPMTCITWYEAFAFCAWDGGFLPTDAELSYAALGGSEQRAYPWSNPADSLVLDCSYANSVPEVTGTACVNPPTGAVNRVGSESPNGDGKYGHADLAGNVREWALDWNKSPYGSTCNDCANLSVGLYPSRAARGGGATSRFDTHLRGGEWGGGDLPSARHPDLGVRCARTPAPR